jgi:acyl dehydratase
MVASMGVSVGYQSLWHANIVLTGDRLRPRKSLTTRYHRPLGGIIKNRTRDKRLETNKWHKSWWGLVGICKFSLAQKLIVT